jgi:hypothetical protein
MKIVWNYVLIGLLTVVAAAVVVGGEPASAELRLAEAATAAGTTLICSLTAPGPITSTPD